MAKEADLPVEERIHQLLQHLGIQQAHFAGSNPIDYQGLVTTYPEVIASLSLVTPRAIDPNVLEALALRLLVFNGDRGASAEALGQAMVSLPDATLVGLPDYMRSNFADVIADRVDSIGANLLDFLGELNQRQEARAVPLSESEGEFAGISYRIRGSGPPLLLLPIETASSQWDLLLPQLAQHYSTITLGGAWLGVVANLEARAKGSYLEVVQKVVDETELQAGERVLDVGCGPGGLDRWLAHRTGGANPIVGVDISTYLLREAEALARSEGLEEVIEFREADAEVLPFPDNSFDVSLSFTVIQAVDADQMLGEMVRVTKPGGRIGILANAADRPIIINLPLRADLRTKAEGTRGGGGSNPQGCNDASLYRRIHQVGLTQVKMFPQLATYNNNVRLQFMEGDFFPVLTPQEIEEWRAAVAEGEAEGTYFIAEPYHCAVGTKLEGESAS